jgi:membrane protein required for colicin V production
VPELRPGVAGEPITDAFMPITVLDVVVIVVVLISAILAMVRGFVREVLSVASWAAAAAAAYFLYKPIVPLVKPYIENETVAIIVAAAAIFFIALIVASYITMKISDFVIDSRVGALDRAFGFLFGAARGLLLVVIALLFFGWLVQHPPTWIANARSKPILDNLGERLMAALPQDFEAAINKRLHGGDTGATGDATPPPDTAEPTDPGAVDTAPPGTGYGTGARQGLDQLIENSGAGSGGKTPAR